MEAIDGDVPTLARKVVVSRQLFFSHRAARVLFTLGILDVMISLVFCMLPDDRDADAANIYSIFVAQAVLAWLNAVTSAILLALVYVTYSVALRELTFERQSRIAALVVTKVGQILIDMALTAYPTVPRQFVALSLVFFGLLQIAYGFTASATHTCQ